MEPSGSGLRPADARRLSPHSLLRCPQPVLKLERPPEGARGDRGMAATNARERSGWAHFKRDAWTHPSVGPVAATLLTLLGALIVWLTIEYAADSIDGAGDGGNSGGVISAAWGYRTIAAMTLLTLAAGFEPLITRRTDRWWRASGRRGFRLLWPPLRWTLNGLAIALYAIPKMLSLAWSIVDYALARPLALLAGAGWRGWGKRYAHFGVIAIAAAMLGLFAPPTLGLPAVIAGLVAILAIVRRWTWVEADRDTFLVERGEREKNSVLRIGFKQDLRDEALLALACLFLLAPIGLDQVQNAACAAGKCAFVFDRQMPTESLDRLVVWLGYFGAELAKTVPFVDWSEVFNVANDSGIEANSELGAQIAFLLRAGLDLLFLAAVLQAVQIAGRLREQDAAFHANRLPILEPFSERVELRRVAEGLQDELDFRPDEQPVVVDFPNYEARRLKELIAETGESQDETVRKAAAALLQRVYVNDPDNAPDVPRFFTERVKAEQDSWLTRVASGLAPDDAARLTDEGRRARLRKLVAEDWADARVRSAAARALGRMRLDGADKDVLLARLRAPKEDVGLRAAAAVALAKARTPEAAPMLAELARAIPDDPAAIMAAMATAYALAHSDAPATEIAARFAPDLRAHALRAASIQRAPMHPDAASVREPGEQSDQMVLINPGAGAFPSSFKMGSSDAGAEAFPSEKPQREVTMTRAYALGRFPVTQDEYLGFCRAAGMSPLQYSANSRWPVVEVSWHDAMAYCGWLNAVTGEAYRLPSEAEWEFACRAGNDAPYSWGPEWDNAKANSNQSGLNRPSDVGDYEPNGWQFSDMHGNVNEWCADPLHKNYQGTPPNDQRPWLADGDFSLRVLRGGSWSDRPQDLRSAYRLRINPSSRYFDVGFRVARTVFSP